MTPNSSSRVPETLLAVRPLPHEPGYYLSKAVQGHADIAATVAAHVALASARGQAAATAAAQLPPAE